VPDSHRCHKIVHLGGVSSGRTAVLDRQWRNISSVTARPTAVDAKTFADENSMWACSVRRATTIPRQRHCVRSSINCATRVSRARLPRQIEAQPTRDALLLRRGAWQFLFDFCDHHDNPIAYSVLNICTVQGLLESRVGYRLSERDFTMLTRCAYNKMLWLMR